VNPSLGNGDVFRLLKDLGENAASADGGDNAARLSTLVCNIKPDSLAAAIKSETNITARKRMLGSIAAVASPDAILTAAKASAYAYERPLTDVLSALLNKLARNAKEASDNARVAADHAFRDLFRDIIDGWSATTLDMSAGGYDVLFQQEEVAAEPVRAGSVTPEPERIVDLAFETGASGNVVWSAVSRVAESEQGIRSILDRIKRAPEDSKVAKMVAQQFANAARLAILLHEDPVDFDAVDAILPHMGDNAAAALLDGLIEAKSRATRRGVIDRLVQVGPGISHIVAERLKSDERWFVQRNMLTLLREAKCSLDNVQLDRFTGHTDARVRREATQLMFTNPMERDRALAAAMRDTDPETLKIALKAARESMPESIVPILAKRVVDPDFPPEFRTSALLLLTRSNSVLALEALLRFAMGGTTLLGKPKLAPKSQEMLIAIGGLARAWPNERRASGLIALAKESKDPEIAKAVTAGYQPDEKVDDDADD
jgi:hypothetical protein